MTPRSHGTGARDGIIGIDFSLGILHKYPHLFSLKFLVKGVESAW